MVPVDMSASGGAERLTELVFTALGHDRAMPVPAGMSLPIIAFSFRPISLSERLLMAASVSTRVVSWNDAAEMNESVDSDAFVIPSSTLL